MDKRKSPLKKVIGEDELGREILECGHHIFAPQDIAGKTNAYRRRCWRCARGKEVRFRCPICGRFAHCRNSYFEKNANFKDLIDLIFEWDCSKCGYRRDRG